MWGRAAAAAAGATAPIIKLGLVVAICGERDSNLVEKWHENVSRKSRLRKEPRRRVGSGFGCNVSRRADPDPTRPMASTAHG